MAYYSTDSEEHLVNIGAKTDSEEEHARDWMMERQELEAWNDYLDDIEGLPTV